jgi:hypothetical protein
MGYRSGRLVGATGLMRRGAEQPQEQDSLQVGDDPPLLSSRSRVSEN